MNRRKFIQFAGATLAAAGTASYALSDKSNVSRSDIEPSNEKGGFLQPDETKILSLASLAPSGHNTQPWFVQHLEPYHWIVGSDKTKWLPAVDPTQRETMLSIGTFLCNLELAASSLGYGCDWSLLATTNQDERVMRVKLLKRGAHNPFDTSKIINRRTVWSHFSGDVLRPEDVKGLIGAQSQWIHYLPTGSRESGFLSEQTLEANRLQSYHDPAQQELADWIRFSSQQARQHRDGLTTASMEIDGVSGWIVRNFYGKDDVMKPDFRQKNIDKVSGEVSQSAGWFLITSPDSSPATLLETGKRMQRLFLEVREKNIAIHPMTQVLEEPSIQKTLSRGVGIGEPIQFILRTGYLKSYPAPVSLRRPVAWFVR